jgi:hypothetical protein
LRIYLKLLLFTIIINFFSCAEDTLDDAPDEENFIDRYHEIMWYNADYDDYVGFSNDSIFFLRPSYISYDQSFRCQASKLGENIMDQWECYESNAGATETYKIVSHTLDILVFNAIHYDYSCGEPFTTNYQYTYSVDGDILFEEIVFEGLTPSSSSYLKSQSTFAEFTKTCAQ